MPEMTQISSQFDADDMADLALVIAHYQRRLPKRPRGQALRLCVRMVAANIRKKRRANEKET